MTDYTSGMNATKDRELRNDGLWWELVDGEWVPPCHVSCFWGHKHRTQDAASACNVEHDKWAEANGWIRR